ncbi:MAG: C45 family peptidase [Phycisphaerales bacterium]
MVRRILITCVVLVSTSCVLSCRTTEVHTRSNASDLLAKGYRHDENGWIFLHTEGKPFERGFQRGYLTANEIDEFLRALAYVEEFETGQNLDFFVRASSRLFRGKVPAEYVEEMRGIAAGMNHAGKKATFDQVLYMNGFIDVLWYWWPQHKKVLAGDHPGCSAFIATGDATADGQIVMAHNSWVGYALGKSANLIVEIVPEQGHRILMQSWGPLIYSGLDFFLTGAGLVGTETTIGGFEHFNRKGTPVFARARQAMQYAGSIDEWADIMIRRNSGAYANSWLLGDTRTGEIACLELGLKHHSLQRKTNGYFSGSNVAADTKILRMETDATWDDVRDNAVSRRVRWDQLMKEHYGRIDVAIAKRMLADHHDVYLQKEQPSSRTICGHAELDDASVPGTQGAYRPGGAFDGKVVDSEMAKSWRLWAKWGGSCDLGFDAEGFLAAHPQYNWLKGYLPDLPPKPWTILPPERDGGATSNR